MVEYHPFSPKDQMIIHQFGKKVLLGVFLGYELFAGGMWKGDILMADLEDLAMMDASDIYPRRIKAKGSIDQPERKRLRIPSTHSKAVRTCKDWKNQ